MTHPTYHYLGDRFTDPKYKGQPCTAVRRPDGKCIRGKNGNMLVRFETGVVNVVARLLRKNKLVEEGYPDPDTDKSFQQESKYL